MWNLNKFLKTTATALAMLLVGGAAFAAYPDKPIKVIVPFGAGGDSDLSTRVWANAMEKELDIPVIVINKTGGGGVIGTTFVAKAKPDGYTLVNAGLSNMLVTPNFSKVPFDYDSFQPIVKLTSVPLAIAVKADAPYKNFEEFVAVAKENTLTQGSWGAASSGTILANIIANQAGYKPKYVHGNTTADSMILLIGGHIDSAVSFPPAFDPHVKSERARILIINRKMDAYPDVPTFAERGIEGNFEGWSGIFAPKGVPQEVVTRLVEATEKTMEDPKVRKAYENMGAVVDFRYGDEWDKDMKMTYDMMKNAADKMKQ